MREHKYRAWNRVTKKMWWFDLMWGNMHAVGSGWIGMVDSPTETKKSRAFSGDNRTQVDPDDCEIMDYTGLKDSYSIDEYFGDIIEEKDGVRLIIEDGLSSVWYKNIKTGGGKYFWQLDVHKVIGNIFENPELWEKE